MSGEYTFGASDDIVRRIRENLPHIEWEQPLAAERERLAAAEIERLRAEVERLRVEVDEKRADVSELIAQIVRRDDEIVRLWAAGDALAVRHRKTFGLDGAFDTELRQWEAARRG